MLAEGGTRMLSVKHGPSKEARIIGSRWAIRDGLSWLVLEFDRDVEEPTLTVQAELEQRLAELEAEVRDILQLAPSTREVVPERIVATVAGGQALARNYPVIAAILREPAQESHVEE
jgi:hypothetical protein